MPETDRLQIRPPTLADVAAVTALCAACDVEEYGAPDVTEADVRSDWSHPGFDLARSAWLAEASSGEIVGYAALWVHTPKVDLVGDFYVRPGLDGAGLGAELVSRVETRSREVAADAPAESSPVLGFFIASVSPKDRALLEGRGYAAVRSFFRMWIDLSGGLEAPRWPAGIECHEYRPDADARDVHAAMTEAFADHFRPRREAFEDWRSRRTHHESYDPKFWLVAREGDAVAGALIGYRYPDVAWVHELGVRPAWRRRGVGLALLLASFEAFHRDGQSRVCLGVDAESPTGATRLYERAGMTIERRHDLMQRGIR